MGLEIIQEQLKSSIELTNKEIEKTELESKEKINKLKEELKDMEKAFEKSIESLVNKRKAFEKMLGIGDAVIEGKNMAKVLATKNKGPRKEKDETIMTKEASEVAQDMFLHPTRTKKKMGRPKKVTVIQEAKQNEWFK